MEKDAEQQTVALRLYKPGHGLRWYWALAVIGLALLTTASCAVIYFQVYAQQEDLNARQLRTGAEGLAGRLSAVNQFRKELLGSLSSDPSLMELFLEGDEMALKHREEQLNDWVPGVLRLRLLPVGINEIDTRTTPHLGYASLEQLRLAEKAPGVLPAEVHQFGTSQQHISIAVGVREGKESPVGLMHVAFPLGELQAALDSVGDYGGRVEVQQLAPGADPFSVVHTGPAGMDLGSPDGNLKITDSIWRVAYWRILDQGKGFLKEIILLTCVVLLVLASSLLFFLMVRIGKALKLDQRNVLSMAEALIVGRPPKKLPAQMADMQPMLDVLYHQIKGHRVSRADLKKGNIPFTLTPDSTGGMIIDDGDEVSPPVSHEDVELSASIFRAYDIRGLVGDTLTKDVINLLGQSIGSEIYENGSHSVVVGRDGRESSEALQGALIAGLQATGREVIDIGLVPTPVLYFAAQELNADCGVMVTGSHNPKDYNGLKIIEKNESLTTEAIQMLRQRIDAGQLLRGDGSFDSQEIIPAYIERIVSDVRLARPLKVVIDCGNGAASVVAPDLYRELGCDVIELYCVVDGSFPNHHPDPGQPKNMQDLRQAVLDHQADIGLGFDGDGDRLGVVDSAGKMIWPDRLLMYLAIDVLSREPGGDIIYDVKCTRHLANVVLSNGGRPLMWKSGHSMLKAKMKETNALLAGEFSGHIMFSERWYGFDDGLYAGARLLEILALDYRTSEEAFAELPDGLSTPEYILPMVEGENKKIMQALNELPDLPGARMVKIDGLRAEFEQGWGLVRASNTTPAIIFRFEADTQEGLDLVKATFRDLIEKVDASLNIPF